MRFEEYQALAMRTSTNDHDRVLNGCLGLIGESGEIVDIVKKWKFQSGDNADLPVDKLLDECGDVLWYCAEFATGMNDDLYELYKIAHSSFDQMTEINKNAEIWQTAARLATACAFPFYDIFDREAVDESDPDIVAWHESNAKSEVIGIVCTVRDIPQKYCGASLEDCMQHNIDKLRRRYPEGFDPERSLHREE